MRKHSLLQIEQARADVRLWKAECERVAADSKSTAMQYQQKTAALENTLSTARGRLAAAQQRSQALEVALAAAKDGESAQTAAGAKRFGAGKLREGNGLVRLRKL